MKQTPKYFYILVSLVGVCICSMSFGAFFLSFERNLQADLADSIKSLEKKVDKLHIANSDLKVKIANEENPHILKLRAAANLEPISDKMVVWASYDNFEGGRVEASTREKLVLSFRAPAKLGTYKTASK